MNFCFVEKVKRMGYGNAVSSGLHYRIAKWSKALVSGTSHFGGVGSNPTSVIVIKSFNYAITVLEKCLLNST